MGAKPLEAQAGQGERKTLLESIMDAESAARACSIEYWLGTVAQGDWLGLEHGHKRGRPVPQYMREPGPLREALIQEFSFRAMTEEMATRYISFLVLTAPSQAGMDFYVTQLVDEARHADAFRWHLVELGLDQARLPALIKEIVGTKREAILAPLERFTLEIGQAGDFIGGVILLSIIGEGALAPAAEMSERKWRVLDPPAGEIGYNANLDELRHLGVGTEIVRQHLQDHPGDRDHYLALIDRGMRIWDTLPIFDLLYEREVLFQEGMEQHADLLETYEIVPGRRLIDTTVVERLELQLHWSSDLQVTRLGRMGLRAGTDEQPGNVTDGASAGTSR